MKKRAAAVVLSLAMAASLPFGSIVVQASENTQAETVEKDGVSGHMITDHAGNEVFIPEEINRIVVADVYPMASVLTVFLGSAEKVAGIHPVSMAAAQSGILGEIYPEILEADTGFMEGAELNLESLLALEPDVVFYNAGNKELGESISGAGMNAVGIAVNKWEFNAVDTYNAWAELLGQIFPEKSEAAEKVTEYGEKILADVQERTADLTEDEKKKVLFLYQYDDTTMITSGKNFFGQFWCDATGSVNVAEDVQAETSSAAITMEQVYEWNPDEIFITNFTPTNPEDLYENTIGEDDWSSITAVQNEEVYKFPLGTYRTYTPSTDAPMTLLWMAQKVYPDMFEDVDIAEETKEYYSEVYGVELTDDQIGRMYHDEV